MCNCNNKISNICVNELNSKCLSDDGGRGGNSKITSTCANQFEINRDVYDLIDELKSDTDVFGNNNCLTYDDQTINTKVFKHSEEICKLIDRLTILEEEDFCQKSIENCGLDLMGLVDNCGVQPKTITELLQIIITTIQTI